MEKILGFRHEQVTMPAVTPEGTKLSTRHGGLRQTFFRFGKGLSSCQPVCVQAASPEP